jgi:hypothetical protein
MTVLLPVQQILAIGLVISAILVVCVVMVFIVWLIDLRRAAHQYESFLDTPIDRQMTQQITALQALNKQRGGKEE